MEDFSGGGRRGRFIIINIRPNDERDGLVLYTYDEDVSAECKNVFYSMLHFTPPLLLLPVDGFNGSGLFQWELALTDH